MLQLGNASGGGGRTNAKVPVVRLAVNARASWGGVWEEKRDALLCRGTEEITFLRPEREQVDGNG